MTGPARGGAPQERIAARTKLVFGLGDHTLNFSLSSLSLFYLFFLTEIAELRPALAGSVLLVGRFVDGFTDPVMGRLSDLTPWRWGRRRPYFVIGMVPFGVCFGLLWGALPFETQLAKFAYYAALYALYSVASTVLAVPYTALIPELTSDYQERTSVNTFRSALAILGTLLAAVGTKQLAESLGGGVGGYSAMGVIAGVWVMLPWFAVYRVTWERSNFRREVSTGFLDALKGIARHRSYQRLLGLYLFGRMAMDLVGAMLVFYFTYWIRRPDHVEITLAVLLLTVVASLPFWLRISTRVDKRTLFIIGTSWWVVFQLSLLVAGPGWPAWTLFAFAALIGIGYAVTDLIPWAMLGEVVDEDELSTGERREGMYAGFMTFVRKLAGASGVWVAGLVLDLAGYVGGQPEQADSALQAIRGLTGAAPALLLAIAATIAIGYPLGRARHREILAALSARRAKP
ncbi:MAG: MFS transporter [Deltaproteobacteria bacterium]|nr:MAG: MFS transporter [Deltaproteobacteria bacterium]